MDSSLLAGYAADREGKLMKPNPGCRNLKFVKLYGMKGVTGYEDLKKKLFLALRLR